MRYVPALLMAALTALCVYLYIQVIDLNNKVRAPTTTVVVKESTGVLNQDLALKLLRSTVRITQLGDQGNGSGVVLYTEKLAEKKYCHFFLTAGHCVLNGKERANQMVVERFNYHDDQEVSLTTVYFADFVAADYNVDLALLKAVDDEPFPMVPRLIRDVNTSGLRLYDPVFAIGCPVGNLPYITNGNIAGFRVHGNHIGISAPIFFGNSGGPLFASDGRLLGINKMMARGPYGFPYSHSGFAVPPSAIIKFLESNDAGFIAHSDDGSSYAKLDKIVKDRARAKKLEEERKAREERESKEALKKAVEDFIKRLKVEDQEPQNK